MLRILRERCLRRSASCDPWTRSLLPPWHLVECVDRRAVDDANARQGLDQFGEGRPPHTVAGRRRDDDRQLQSLCRFGQGDDVVLQFACRIVAHASHEANLMVDEDKRGVFRRKRLIRADLIGHYTLLELKGLSYSDDGGRNADCAAARLACCRVEELTSFH